MATMLTYDTNGIREDLQDAIYDISPTSTPFMSTIGRTKAKNTYHEWQTDNLADVDPTNAQLEGADAVAPALETTDVFSLPSVSLYNDALPKAVLLLPVVFSCKDP
jgi:hypothetical protein